MAAGFISCRQPVPPSEGEAEALELLGHLALAGGADQLFYRTLVMEERIAVSAWDYDGEPAVDQSRFDRSTTTPAPGVSLEMAEGFRAG